MPAFHSRFDKSRRHACAPVGGCGNRRSVYDTSIFQIVNSVNLTEFKSNTRSEKELLTRSG